MEKAVDISLSVPLKYPTSIPKLQVTQVYNFILCFHQNLLTYYPVD